MFSTYSHISQNHLHIFNSCLNIFTTICLQYFLDIFNSYFHISSPDLYAILICILSLSCVSISTGIPDPLPPPISIIHRSRLVFKYTSCIGTDLLYVGSSWSYCLCSSMCGSPLEYVTYEFVPTSPAECCMSGSYNLDSFRDEWYVTV